MFDHVLIPTDLSDRAWRPIEMTKQIVEDRHASVTLLHVVEEIAGATREAFGNFYEDLERRPAGSRPMPWLIFDTSAPTTKRREQRLDVLPERLDRQPLRVADTQHVGVMQLTFDVTE